MNQSDMTASLVNKLLQSFDELDRCIAVTREVLSSKSGVPADVLSRVDHYSEIVQKQRALAGELQGYIIEQRWEEVARHVRLINGFSTMIRDDAQSILANVNTPEASQAVKELLA